MINKWIQFLVSCWCHYWSVVPWFEWNMRTSADNVFMNDGSVYQVPHYGPPFKFHNLSRYVQELFGIVPFAGLLIKLNRTPTIHKTVCNVQEQNYWMWVLFQDVWNMWFKMASSEISTNSIGNDRVTLLYSINMKLRTVYGFVWKCWVNIPNEIAIFHRDNDQQNHWVQWGTQHFQTNPYSYGYDKCREFSCKSGTLLFDTYIVG